MMTDHEDRILTHEFSICDRERLSGDTYLTADETRDETRAFIEGELAELEKMFSVVILLSVDREFGFGDVFKLKTLVPRHVDIDRVAEHLGNEFGRIRSDIYAGGHNDA